MTKKKRFPIFYAVYFSLIVLFLVLLFIGLQIVKTYLADYEAAQPQYEAQRIFDTYYADRDFSALLDATETAVTPFEDRGAVLRYLQEYTDGKTITYSEITTGLDSTLKYIVKADDIKFSAFTLQESGQLSEKGFALYAADSFELYTLGTETVTVTVPYGYAVYVNDVQLDDSFLTGNEEHHISCDYMPEGVSGVVYKEYRVDGLYYPPASVKIFAADGRECTPTIAENGSYRADILYSDTLQAEHSEYVIEAAQALSAYMQNDGSFSAIAAYLDPDSELYVNIRTSETYFVIDHSSYAFEDVRTSEFCAYDDNTFSCRVAFTHVLKRYGSKDYKDYIDMTLYLRRVGDRFLIYDRYNH